MLENPVWGFLQLGCQSVKDMFCYFQKKIRDPISKDFLPFNEIAVLIFGAGKLPTHVSPGF
jgi:hypothetical protein